MVSLTLVMASSDPCDIYTYCASSASKTKASPLYSVLSLYASSYYSDRYSSTRCTGSYSATTSPTTFSSEYFFGGAKASANSLYFSSFKGTASSTQSSRIFLHNCCYRRREWKLLEVRNFGINKNNKLVQSYSYKENQEVSLVTHSM